MTPRDLNDDTLICYKDARRLAFGLPIMFISVVYFRSWMMGGRLEFWMEIATIFGAALLYALGEIRCEIIRSDIRRQRLEDGF